MRALAAVAVAAVLAAGCLASRDDDPAAEGGCTARLHPEQVPTAAPQAGGLGPRTITVLLDVAHDPVTAWWPGANGTVEVVRVRTGDGFHATIQAPAGKAIGLLGGLATPATGQNTWDAEGFVAPGGDDVEVTLGKTLVGSLTGSWTQPATAGFAAGPAAPSWQPQDLPWADQDRIQRLEQLVLTLHWDNGPEGGADFGIAIGPAGSTEFHWVNAPNAANQASPGAQSEQRVIAAADLADLGWSNVTGLRAGPSVSTGAFATTGIAYTLDWDASFMPGSDLGNLCRVLGDVRAIDVTDGSAA